MKYIRVPAFTLAENNSSPCNRAALMSDPTAGGYRLHRLDHLLHLDTHHLGIMSNMNRATRGSKWRLAPEPATDGQQE
jgi:hypothetical protein